MITLDLKNNKLKSLSDEVFLLQKMKLLDMSNNDLQNLPPELGLMRELTKIQIEGNPLRSIKMSIRMGGTNNLKKYLQGKIDPNKNLALIGQGGNNSNFYSNGFLIFFS